MGYPIRKWNDVLSIISGKNQKVVADSSGQYPIYGSGGIMGYANNYLCEAGTTIIGRKGTINRPIFVNERFGTLILPLEFSGRNAPSEVSFLFLSVV